MVTLFQSRTSINGGLRKKETDLSDFSEKIAQNITAPTIRNQISPFGADVLVNDGDVIKLGNSKVKVMYTPGHTIGSVCYLIDDMMFSGDTLFRGEIGRTDLKSGNMELIKVSLKKLYELNKEYIVYPGHGLFTLLSKEKLKYTGLM